MSYQKKMQMIDEANKQTKALSKLGKWLRNIKVISTIFFIISYENTKKPSLKARATVCSLIYFIYIMY